MTAPASKMQMTPSPPVPPMQNGDELTRAEFERRYEAMPDLKKAELIEGVVFMPSPVSIDLHAEPHFDIGTWLGTYRYDTPGVRGGTDATVRLDLNNEPQPDLVLFIDPRRGGKATVDADRFIAGGPELAVEIASSSVGIDSGRKLKLYQRCNVLEYIIWRVRDGVIDWFVLQGSQFNKMEPGPDGILRSTVFPGLWLDAAALIACNLPRVKDVLSQGLATPEHAAFVAKLRQAFPPT